MAGCGIPGDPEALQDFRKFGFAGGCRGFQIADFLHEGDHALRFRPKPQKSRGQQNVAVRCDEVPFRKVEPEPDGCGDIVDDGGIGHVIQAVSDPFGRLKPSPQKPAHGGLPDQVVGDLASDVPGKEKIAAFDIDPVMLQEIFGGNDKSCGFLLPEDIEKRRIPGRGPDEFGQKPQGSRDGLG